jgi:hypothetical protein
MAASMGALPDGYEWRPTADGRDAIVTDGRGDAGITRKEKPRAGYIVGQLSLLRVITHPDDNFPAKNYPRRTAP